jgi:CO/xanthine dehydrogenase FAD-binding subunit
MDYLFRPKTYLRPQTLEETLSLLDDHGGSAKIVAGGTDLLVERPGGVECLIDVGSLPLDYIRLEGGVLRVGALTTIESINVSEITTGPFYVLKEASDLFGHRNVRNLATVGGNLCSSVPSADMATPLIALDSVARIASVRGERTVPLEEFFVFVRESTLEEDEMLVEVQVHPQPARTGTAFAKIGRTSVDIALVNVAVRITLGEDGTCSDVRIALGSVAPTPMRCPSAEGLLRGKGLDEALIEEAAQAVSEEIRPISDVRSSAEYRRDASRVLAKRCIVCALERARGGSL